MNAQNKILIIIGSAPCVTEDIASLLCAMNLDPCSCSYMLIGLDAVEKHPAHAEYFATYHPSDIGPAFGRRKAAGANTDYMIIAHQPHIDASTGRDLVDLIIPFEPPTGSSALLGVLAGIKLGYEKIIVCGCPLMGKNDKQYDYANFRAGWTAKLAMIKDKTRSMSGWTKELLGAPTKEWLDAVIPAKAGIQK
jgi:hypothetical protein